MLHVPNYYFKINQKLLFKGIGVGGVTLPHELRLFSLNLFSFKFIFLQFLLLMFYAYWL